VSRIRLVALLAGGALLVPATGVVAGKPWRPHMRAAKAYAGTRTGTVRISVRARHRAWGWRETLGAPSASVLKAMLLVAYLDDPRVRDRALSAGDRALIEPMIRWSDNTAASNVLAFVGPQAVRSVARRAGMRRFVLDPSTWGLSRIDADDQSRFFRWIDRRVSQRHRATAMHLLATVVPSQRWGIGQVRPRGWALYFKGGWGSGSGAVEHQVALLRRGERRVSVAVLTSGSPSHAYATETLQGVFARLLRGLAVARPGRGVVRSPR
jgi:hypothetical protein